MDWQLGIVLLLVALAAGYLIRQTWRTWRGASSGCRGSCGCSQGKTAPAKGQVTLIPAQQLTLRRRDARG